MELSTLVLIHTKQCLVNNSSFRICTSFVNSNSNSALCVSHFHYSGCLSLSIDYEGVKNNVFFLHQHYARSCTWYVSVKNCLADAFFGRSTHTLDLPSRWKRNLYGIETLFNKFPQGVGGVKRGFYLARKIFILGSSHFFTPPVR